MSWTRKSKRGKSSAAKFEPHKYQVEGIKWLLKKSYAGLFWDPGLGKTATVLHAFKILKDQGFVDTLLIVAKRRIITDVWPAEVKKWRLGFRSRIIRGTQEQRYRMLREPADVYLTNFENLEWFCSKQIRKAWSYGFGRIMFVVDESTKLKHVNTKRFKALRHCLKHFDRRIILTGTPMPNGMMNLYGQMFVVDMGESLGQYVGQFRNDYFHPSGYGGYHWTINDGAEEEIYKAIAPRILRLDTKTAGIKLPPLFFVDRKATLNEEAQKLYDTFSSELLAMWKDELLTAKNAGVLTNKLRQVANGAIYKNPSEFDDEDKPEDTKRVVIELHDDKLDALKELLEELNGKPALIAYEFAHDRERITKMLLDSDLPLPTRGDGERYVPYIGGGVKDKVSSEHLERWNAGELPVLLGHPDSIAHGLNMQGTNGCIIFFALPWNLENYIQLIKRLHRQGVKQSVLVYRIICEGTVDEAILSSLGTKEADEQRMLAALLAYTMRRHNVSQEKEGEEGGTGEAEIRSILAAFQARGTSAEGKRKGKAKAAKGRGSSGKRAA